MSSRLRSPRPFRTTPLFAASSYVADVLSRELAQAFKQEPSAYGFRLRMEYPYLRRPRGNEERAIREFVASLGGGKPPFQESLALGDDVATIYGLGGAGVFQTMSMGGGWPEPLDEDWLLGKVRDHANTARGQIPGGDHVKVFVINIDTASASLSHDFINRAKAEVLEVFNNDVLPKVLFFRNPLGI